jgi:hypothetical protein
MHFNKYSAIGENADMKNEYLPTDNAYVGLRTIALGPQRDAAGARVVPWCSRPQWPVPQGGRIGGFG